MVVTAVWGTELIKFLATLAILHKGDYSSYRPGAIHPILHIVLAQFILFLNRPYAK